MTDETASDDPTAEATADHTSADARSRDEQATERGIESLAVGPDALIDREGVEFREEAPVEHQSHFDHYEPIEGVVAVGVTNGAGEVLLFVNGEEDHAVLPHGPVEAGEDWAAVARREVEDFSGVPVEIQAVERVRRKYYTPEDDDRRITAYDVVLRASPVADGIEVSPLCDDNDWEVGWFDGTPVDIDEGAETDDIRLFLG